MRYLNTRFLANTYNRTRQIKSSGFDLILPGQSRTPLKPRKSGKVQKTPLPKLAPLKSSRRTPKLANAKVTAKPKSVSVLPLSKPTDIDGEDDLLASSETGKIEARASTNKRKFTDDGKILEGTKKAKIDKDNGKKNSKVARRGRPTQQKPATSAYDLKPPENFVPAKKHVKKELSCSPPANEDPSVSQEHFSTHQVNEEFLTKEKEDSGHSRADVDDLLNQRSLVTQSKAPKVTKISKQVDSIPSVAMDTAEASTRVAPTKRRKKRRSIGQQSMRANKRPSIEAKTNLLPGKPTATSPDPMKEPPGFHSIPEERLRNRTPLLENKMAQSLSRHDKAPPDLTSGLVKSLSEIQAPQEKRLARPEPQIKQKPRKKRKPIAQVRKPKKPIQRNGKAAVPTVEALTDKHKDTSSIKATATANPPQNRSRKPLANVTNVIKAPKAKLASKGKDNAESISHSIKILKPDHPTGETKQAFAPPEPPPAEERETFNKQMNGIHKKRSKLPPKDGPPKKRGRPRKQPQTAPPPLADADADHPAKPQAVSKPSKRPTKTSKPNKRPPKISKLPPKSVPITVYRPAPTLDSDSDSDDPLSLGA